MFIKKLFMMLMEEIKAMPSPSARTEAKIWPSELTTSAGPFSTGECSRSLYYKIKGEAYSNPVSMRLKTIGDIGKRCEDDFIDLLKKNNMWVEDQVRITFKFPDSKNNVFTNGKLDVIIKDDEVYNILEIKTIDGFKVNDVFGYNDKRPLPSANNLMQAMVYKYKSRMDEIELKDGSKIMVKDVYLAYVDRGSNSKMYFKIDLTEDGYPVITSIRENGSVIETIDMSKENGFEELIAKSTTSTSDDARLAACKININDIFEKSDRLYQYILDNKVPPKDYSLMYSDEELERQYHCGRISKIKYNKQLKGKEKCGDFKCSTCAYLNKCLSDDGIKIKLPAFNLRA